MSKRATLGVIDRHLAGLPSPRSLNHPLQLIRNAVSLEIPSGALLNGLTGKSLPDPVIEAVTAYAATMK